MNKTPRVSAPMDAESTLYASIRALVESARSNLKLMRQFYVQYAQRIGQTAPGFSDGQAPCAISQTLTDLLTASNVKRPFNLSWSHYVFLLGIKKPDECSFYEIESSQQNWTVRELRRHG